MSALAAQMSAPLAHRGGPQIDCHVNSDATIILREPHGTACLGVASSGLHVCPETRIAVALCGWLTSIDDPELRQQAQSRKCDFHRALVQRIRERGLDVVQDLQGAFILVVQDGSTLHIVRDGAGNRAVYYGRMGDRWLFAIEPKSITSVPHFSKRIRPAALAQYLACSFVPSSGTMLENLYEVQAGHTVSLQTAQEPEVRRWFRFEESEGQASIDGTEPLPHCLDADSSTHEGMVRLFRREFERAVAERIPRGEPVGVFLSGGLDSSVVTAELSQQIGGKNVRTWSIHFGPKYPNELQFARAVAERCGTVHEEVLIQPRHFLSRLRKMIWHLDDPIGDPITQPNYELAAHVGSDVRYVFNGEGGDPCFGGPKNVPMMLHHWYGGLDRGDNFRERHYLESFRRAWTEVTRLLSEEVQRQVGIERDVESIFTPYFRTTHPRLFLNRLTSINIREKGAHLIQPKVERMLGAHGLTPLAPLFDERIIQLSFQMPAQLKLSGGVEKIVLKRAYEHELPLEVIRRPKSGMRVPVHYWFRAEMRRYARSILTKKSVRSVGIFNPERVQQLLAYDTEEGIGRYGLRLWMLITFELWRRIVVDGEAA